MFSLNEMHAEELLQLSGQACEGNRQQHLPTTILVCFVW
jgi:hypothetical protein